MSERVSPPVVTPRPRSQWRQAWSRFAAHRFALVSLGFCVLVVLVAALAPVLAPYHYTDTDYDASLLPTGSPGHPFGTDELGRDTLSRVVYSLRTALAIGIGAELVALLIALVIGLTAGYLGGRAEQLLMSFTDVMYAFPVYLFTILLVAVLGRGAFAIVLAIGIASFVTQGRLIRAQVLSIKQREYVEAARAMGASGPTIAVRYILPNAVGPVLVTTSFGIPNAIIAASGLALLGLGIQPPTPDLGTLLADGVRWALAAPHLLLWPALVFALLLLAFTWVGDGVRDAFDVGEVGRAGR